MIRVKLASRNHLGQSMYGCEEEVGKKLEESSGDNVSDITRHFKNLDDAIDKRLHYKIDYKPTLRCEEWLDEGPWSKQKER